ncbi:MAG: ligand-binding sensor domain-containing protein, partial [Flammeovirgaceae bacterium]
MRQQFFSFLIYCIAIFFSTITISFGQNTVGLNPEKKIHQYLIDNWTTDNGLPYNNLSHVFQAKNGYIWISTFEGLIRFDGKTFEIFTQKDFDVFKTNGIYQVDEDQEGRLWLGTQGSGLLSYQNGKMENTTPNFDKPISAVLASKNGVIWMGTINSGVYSLIDGRHEELVFEGLTKAAIRKIIEDDKGRIWIASEGHGLFMYDHGAMTHYTVEDKLLSDRVVALAVGKKGEVWVGTTKGLAKFSDGVFSEVAGFENIRITDLMVDNFGSLWVGTRQGCARMHVDSAAIEWLTQKDGLLGNAISAFTLDREGSMWLCTRRSGLSRIRDGKFVNYSQQMGLSARNINLIAEIAPNEYWIGSDNGTVDIFKEGKMDAYQLPQQFENARIKHLLKDSKGRIWMASYKGVLKIENGEQTYFAKEQGLPEVRARKVFEDRNGNIWVGFRSGGLAKYNEEEGWSIIAAKAGLASEFIMCLGEDKAGNLLVGTNGGGLNIINEQGEISVIDAKQGLNGTLIFNLHVDTAGIVWMATNAGIARYHTGDGNQVTMFSSKDGLPISTPFDIIEDDLGYFWMPSSDGIIRVLKQNIRAYEQGELNEIPYLMYNRGDGLISKECTPSAEVLKSSDGQLWFPNLEGF